MLSSSFCNSSGLGRGFFWRTLFLVISGLGAQFQCRLFLLVHALIFGAPAGSLVECSGLWVLCLEGMAGLRLAILEPFIVDWGTLAGKSALMGSLLGLGKPPQSSSAALLEGTLPSGLPARFLLRGFLLSEALLASSLRAVRRLGVVRVVLDGNLGGSESGLSRRGVKRVRLSRKKTQPVRLFRCASPLGSDDDAGRDQLHDSLPVGPLLQDRVGIG